MLYDSKASRKIYLIFQAESEYFCHKFFKEGFKHVFAVEKKATGWVCIDGNSSNLDATILPASYDDLVIETFIELNPTSTVIELTVAHQPKRIYPRPSIISCVSAMQYVLGVYWPLTITPYQMYTKLVNKDIKHIKVGMIWGAVEQNEQQIRQRKHPERKQKN